jgi:hypothetical protein
MKQVFPMLLSPTGLYPKPPTLFMGTLEAFVIAGCSKGLIYLSEDTYFSWEFFRLCLSSFFILSLDSSGISGFKKGRDRL